MGKSESSSRKNPYLKSPMNYVGNKYKLLPQIMPLLPESDTFVDLFTGGCDVAINYKARRVICNDHNEPLIGIYKKFQHTTYDEAMDYFQKKIKEYSLSYYEEGREGYYRYRDDYNSSDRDPLDLFLLRCYGFNYQLRFNSKMEYNTAFGKLKSHLHPAMVERIEEFLERIRGFEFTSVDFRDFDYSVLKENDLIYCDPPYLISNAYYNESRSGTKGWAAKDSEDLMGILDSLSDRGVKFALSEVIVHKNMENTQLIEWSGKYHVHEIKSNYGYCMYSNSEEQRKGRTVEVLVTNY